MPSRSCTLRERNWLQNTNRKQGSPSLYETRKRQRTHTHTRRSLNARNLAIWNSVLFHLTADVRQLSTGLDNNAAASCTSGNTTYSQPIKETCFCYLYELQLTANYWALVINENRSLSNIHFTAVSVRQGISQEIFVFKVDIYYVQSFYLLWQTSLTGAVLFAVLSSIKKHHFVSV